MKNFAKCLKCVKRGKANKTHSEKSAENKENQDVDHRDIGFLIDNENFGIRLETERNESFVQGVLEFYEIRSISESSI